MHLIIDADPIVYRCGFAAETPTYHLVMEDPVTGVYEAVFAPYDGQTAGARMQKWVQDHPEDTVLEKQKVVNPEPESHAHEAVRTQLYSIEKECRNHYQVEDFDSITIILSGPGNYRDRIATIQPYKGNRDPEHKPHWYQSIRNYLTSEWGARVVHGREADDECSILCHRLGYTESDPRFVVATIDKDLDQIPGEHYNYLKQVFYAQSRADAELFFLQQCLSGDATDGVPGCYKCGDIGAKRIISELVGQCGRNEAVHRPPSRNRAAKKLEYTAANSVGVAIPAIWQGIVRQYEISKSRVGCPYVDREAEALALETARLVYLQKEEGELWIPTGPPHDRLEEYRDE